MGMLEAVGDWRYGSLADGACGGGYAYDGCIGGDG